MNDTSATLAGELANWPAKAEMSRLLHDAGIHVVEGEHSIRVVDCSHFVFRQYGGNLGNPAIDADADTPAELVRDAEFVSAALSLAGIRHRFEVYDHQSNLVAYVHHGWPQCASA